MNQSSLGEDKRNRKVRAHSRALYGSLAFVVVLVCGFVWRTREHDIRPEEQPLGPRVTSVTEAFEREGSDTVPLLPFVAGRVLDPSNQPLHEAQICWSAHDVGVPQGCSTSDPDGRYRLFVPVGKAVTVAARLAGYFPTKYVNDTANPWLVVDRNGHSDIDLVLVPGAARVTGTVMDLLGGGVSGAYVHSLSDAWSFADERGEFELWTWPGADVIRASEHGYVSDESRITAPQTGVSLRLTPESVIHGRVITAIEGEPVSSIEIVDDFDEHGTSTDEQGKFRLGGLTPGLRRVTARGEGLFGTSEPMILDVGETKSDVVISVGAAPGARAHVVLRGTREPCPNAEITVYTVDGLRLRRWVSDAGGTAILDGLMAGRYSVRVDCGARMLLDQPLELGEHVIDVTWELERGVSVTGKVAMLDGRPAPGARVDFFRDGESFGRDTFTSGNGKFVLDGVPSGSGRLSASFSGHQGSAALSMTISGRPLDGIRLVLGERLPQPSIAAVKTMTLHGRVVDEQQDPVADALVSAMGKGLDKVERALSDDQGNVRLENLPEGVYRVVATADGRQIEATNITSERSFTLRLPGVTTVCGSVVGGGDGEGPMEYEVRFDGGKAVRFLDRRSWCLPGVPVGKRSFVVSSALGRGERVIDVRMDTTERVDIQLTGERVAITGIVRVGERPVVGAKIWIFDGSGRLVLPPHNVITDPSGRFTAAVPRGIMEVRVQKSPRDFDVSTFPLQQVVAPASNLNFEVSLP